MHRMTSTIAAKRRRRFEACSASEHPSKHPSGHPSAQRRAVHRACAALCRAMILLPTLA
jgi:hypothetical protein